MSKAHRIQPIERFPTKPRKDGRFEKRIRGELHYFGSGGDRVAALREYNRVKDDLYAGRAPKLGIEQMEEVTLKHLGNWFVDEKNAECKAGNITDGWRRDYKSAIRRFLAFRHHGIGFASRLWHDVRPEDFSAYARYLQSVVGVHAYNRERSCIVAMFNAAVEFEWINRPVKLGKFPKRKAAEARASKKNRLLTVAQIKALLCKATPQLGAMILLGLNGGYGPTDCAKLARSHESGGRIRFARPKTQIFRDMPLWPETKEAIRSIMRPGDELVFRTEQGNPWTDSSIGHEFRKLCTTAEVELPKGVGLNACRHTFATYAHEVDGTGAAYKRLMGRKIADGVDETYIEAVDLKILKRVVNHVRNRLQIRKMVMGQSK